MMVIGILDEDEVYTMLVNEERETSLGKIAYHCTLDTSLFMTCHSLSSDRNCYLFATSSFDSLSCNTYQPTWYLATLIPSHFAMRRTIRRFRNSHNDNDNDNNAPRQSTVRTYSTLCFVLY